jgi:hypothetical protein
MKASSHIDEPQGDKALRSAEVALARIQGYAEAALSDQITSGEAIEQILDELAAHPALGEVRQALSRNHLSLGRPH